jgi:hypothetical protein
MAVEAAHETRIASNCTVISAARDKDESPAVSSFGSEVRQFIQIKFNVL